MNQAQTGSTERRLLSIDQTAEYLSIAPKTIRNRLGPRAENPFPVKPVRFGSRVLFDIRDLDAWIDSL
jgi:predicted DNA-binding transcriptional regulator AlpA